MNLPYTSVSRPITIAMIFLGICIIGIVALVNMPIELMPNISLGQINITVQVRGGIPSSEIEERVSKPIEEAMATVTHLKDILSISKEGECTVVLEFSPGTNMDFAALEVREKFARIKDKLPHEIERPVIAQYGYNDVPIMILAVTSEKYSPEELRDMVDEKIKERLNRISGVAMIDVAGGRERKILIEVDQNRLVAHSLSIEKVIDILNLSNLNLLAGDVERLGSKFLVRAMGEFQTLDEIGNMALAMDPKAGAVRVKDVAEVKDSYLDPSSFARMNVEPVVSLYIQKESLANTIKVAKGIEQEAGRLTKELDKEIHLTLTFNQAEFIKKAVARVNDSLVQGGILATLVLFLFLRDLASVFIIGLSIPISVISIFSLMYLSKITLNVMTLSGLALAVGMLVDNNIVVLENIFKKRAEEMPQSKPVFRKLIIDSTQEMSLAVAASTFTTVIVFLPLIFVNKEIQLLYSGLGTTVTFSLLVSLLVAISLVPMLASKMLKPDKEPGQKPGLSEETDKQAIVSASLKQAGEVHLRPRESFYDKFKDAYESSLRFVLFLRYLFVPLIFALFIFSLRYAAKLEKEFIGVAEQNKFTVFIEMPTGTRLEISDKIVKDIEKIVLTAPEIKSATARVEPWSSKIYVELKPLSQRKRSTQQIIEGLRPNASNLDPAFVYFEEPEEIATKEILIEVYGNDYDSLKQLAMQIGSQLQSIEKLTDTKIRMREGRPEMRLLIDREKAALFGWSVEEIAEVLHAQMRGLIPTRFHAKQDTYVKVKEETLYPEKSLKFSPTEEQEMIRKKTKERNQLMPQSPFSAPSDEADEIEIIARLQEKYRRTFNDLKRIILMSRSGQPILLEQMTDFAMELGPSEIWRKNKMRMVQVSANMGGQALGTVAAKVTAALKKMTFPEGYFWRFGGNYEKMIQNQKELSFAILLTLILVYMVLASLFESLMQPFIILASVPLATIGVVGVLKLTNKPMGVGVLIGAIMLAGIVVNNAIILVDSTNRRRKERRRESIKKAVVVSSGDRLRPILMTTITTLLGLIPMALDKSEAANLWAPLALTVMAGLSSSTFFTLYIVPSIYIIFNDVKRILRVGR